jgi:hypothetical protein
MRGSLTVALCLAAWAAPARSQAPDRAYCPARPGLGTPACTIAPGRVSVEIGIATWERDDAARARTDAIVAGDTLLRVGLTDSVEALIGWTPFGRVRFRDAAGAVETADRVGDVLIGAKANLRNPDGGGFSIAVQPFATLPVGRAPVGAGDWSAGVVAPMSYDLDSRLNLQFSPEVDAAADGDGRGRHLAYGGTLGLGVLVAEGVGVTFEVQAARDRDPDGASAPLLGAVSAGWAPAADRQIDVGATLGLNRDAPDLQLYFGFSQRL